MSNVAHPQQPIPLHTPMDFILAIGAAMQRASVANAVNEGMPCDETNKHLQDATFLSHQYGYKWLLELSDDKPETHIFNSYPALLPAFGEGIEAAWYEAPDIEF